jgi:hypothetical protein
MSQLTREELLKLTSTTDILANEAQLKLKARRLCLDNGTLVKNLKSVVGNLLANGAFASVLNRYRAWDVENATAYEGQAYLEYRIGLKDSPAPDRDGTELRNIFKEHPAILEQLRRDVYGIVNASINAHLGTTPPFS